MYVIFFNDTATTEIYTLSLHDALPISDRVAGRRLHAAGAALHPLVRVHVGVAVGGDHARDVERRCLGDRKSTRLNSSHANISYAVFCLKKKKNTPILFFSTY